MDESLSLLFNRFLKVLITPLFIFNFSEIDKIGVVTLLELDSFLALIFLESISDFLESISDFLESISDFNFFSKILVFLFFISLAKIQN